MPKTILITGSAKNVGAVICERFANHGWNVIINSHSSIKHAVELANKINLQTNTDKPCAIAINADITNPNAVEKLFKTGIEQFGKIDVLVNNAAVYPASKALSELDFIQWNNTLNVNLTASMLTAKEFSRQNITKGRIINISSIGGYNIFKNRIDYNLSKSALIRLTKILAKELAPNISVNCVCPGVVELEDKNNAINVPDTDKIPMQRYANVDDVFDAIYFFANSSHYITGQTICVTGGMEL